MLETIHWAMRSIPGDLISCKNRAEYLFTTYVQQYLIVSCVVLSLLVIGIALRSPTPTLFYLNLVKALILSVITFIFYVLIDTFWFLVIKKNGFLRVVQRRSYLSSFMANSGDRAMSEESKKLSCKAQCDSIIHFYTVVLDTEIKRLGIELVILTMLAILFFPIFFVLYFLFFSMFPIYFMEQKGLMQFLISDDLTLLFTIIKKWHNVNPAACRKYTAQHFAWGGTLQILYEVATEEKKTQNIDP